MAARVTIVPVRRLTWDAFTPVETLPKSGDVQLAAQMQYFYGYRYDPKRVNDHWAPEEVVIRVKTLKAVVLKAVREKGTKKQLEELLVHEQGHASLANLGARGIKWEVSSLRAATPGELKSKMDSLVSRHSDRVDRLHHKYDEETRHGADREQQRRWSDLIEAALKNPRASTIAGMKFGSSPVLTGTPRSHP